MKVFHTTEGLLIEQNQIYYLWRKDLDTLFTHENILDLLVDYCTQNPPYSSAQDLIHSGLLPPVQSQETWASGVTYFQSKIERQKESEQSGGGSFYDRVYHADRPELFFKASPHRVVGHGQQVRIRKDSSWNVPEPELTLAINSNGKIFGYTIGNDMSSRSIEGENPLYLANGFFFKKSTTHFSKSLKSPSSLPINW